MNTVELVVWRNLGVAGMIFLVLIGLGLVMKREWVKDHLRTKGCAAERVRWSLIGPNLRERFGLFGTVFRVSYRDVFGNEHEGWCVVPRYRWRQVKWLRDEIVSTAGNVLREP